MELLKYSGAVYKYDTEEVKKPKTKKGKKEPPRNEINEDDLTII